MKEVEERGASIEVGSKNHSPVALDGLIKKDDCRIESINFNDLEDKVYRMELI